MKNSITHNQAGKFTLLIALILVIIGSGPGTIQSALAQNQGEQRQIRSYVPPDQLVSFLPSTPFNIFVDHVNPIFQRITGKEVIDADNRQFPIGISVSGMHFLDALELVLQYNSLQYRETDRYFMIEEAAQQNLIMDAEQAAATAGGGVRSGGTLPAANLDSRQIEINAVLFELNHSKARNTGIDWSVILGSTGQTGGGSGGAGQQGGGEGSENSLQFFLQTDELFEPLEDIISAPDQVNFSDLNSLFRLAESEGVGETIASPSVTVQSGVEGDIQIGSDVPVQVRDFAGNTVTQFFKTGIIIDVTPTLIREPVADTVGAPIAEFVHLLVKVEKSGSRPSAEGVIIDRSSANTQVLLLDGEQTVIGGLYSTEESISRRGMPVLKDLPGWFFGLRYIFGRTLRTQTQKELMIALQANIVDPVRDRMKRQLPDQLLEQERMDVQRALERFDEDVSQRSRKPKEYKGKGN